MWIAENDDDMETGVDRGTLFRMAYYQDRIKHLPYYERVVLADHKRKSNFLYDVLRYDIELELLALSKQGVLSLDESESE